MRRNKRVVSTFTMSEGGVLIGFMKVVQAHGPFGDPYAYTVQLSWLDTFGGGREWKRITAKVLAEGCVQNITNELEKRETPRDGRGYYVNTAFRLDEVDETTTVVLSFIRFLDIIDDSGFPVEVEDYNAA